MNENQAVRVFKKSEDGRKFVAGYFTNVLLRHDFATYINEHLAADFACALADGLHALQKHCNGFAEQAAFQRDARLGALKEMAKAEGQRNELRTALEEAIEYLEPRVEGGKVGVNLLPRLKAVIASVSGESPTNCDGWISVLDRLPERFLQVLVTVEEDGERFVEIDAYQVNDWCSPSDGRKVTHWRSLLEPAAEQKGGAE